MSGTACTSPPFFHLTEHRAVGDLGGRQPRLDGLDRTEAAATQNGHLGPLPFLVHLAAADPDGHRQDHSLDHHDRRAGSS